MNLAAVLRSIRAHGWTYLRVLCTLHPLHQHHSPRTAERRLVMPMATPIHLRRQITVATKANTVPQNPGTLDMALQGQIQVSEVTIPGSYRQYG